MRAALVIGALVLLSAGAAYAGQTFHGFACTKDCSGHKAGYAWAARKQITAEEDCHGRSRSFREGCIAWVRERKKPPEQPSFPQGKD